MSLMWFGGFSGSLIAAGAFESIATVTVGSGGASSIEFTGIPGTYQHLQLRYLAKTSGGTTWYSMGAHCNNDTANNYTYHIVQGNGSTASAASNAPRSSLLLGHVAAGNKTYFGAGVVDVLDYSSTSKYKTFRSATGTDQNGSGYCGMYSGLWMSTSAVASIQVIAPVASWVEHSTFALYGIKA